jgi:hypothetical protein
MITNRMSQAKEKDERSLGLFNQLRERRGLNVRTLLCHEASCILTPSFFQETSTLPNASSRIPMAHTTQWVDTEVQVRRELSVLQPIVSSKGKVACSPTADAPSEKSASSLTVMPSPTRVRVREGHRSPTDNRYTPGSPHTLTHYTPLASKSQKRPTAGSCSITTTTPVPSVPATPGSPEIPSHRPSSTTITSAIQQSSSEQRDTQPTTVPGGPESASLPSSGMAPHIPVSPSPSPPPPSTTSTRTDPPSTSINAAPVVGPERRNERPSNSPPQSGEKRASSIQNETKIKWSTGDSITWKPSGKFEPFSIPSSPPPAGKRREAPIRLTMPGTFPGMSVDVDVSSWVLVSPVGPVETSKRSWFKRLFTR